MMRILAASALALMLGSTAQAQQGGSGSDHTLPGGAGGGVGGMSGSFVPPISSTGGRAISGSAGQSARALGQALGGNPVALTSMLTTGGVSSGAASTLSQALGALRTNGGWTLLNLVSAINAYNAAVNSLSPGSAVPLALLLTRNYLAAAISSS